MPRVVLAAALAAAIASPARSGAQNNATVDRAVAAWAKVRSLRGSFEQTLTNPLLRTTMHAAGAFTQQKPNKLAIRFTSPAGDAIVADGNYLWVSLQQATPGQVIKRTLTDDMEVPIDIGQFVESPETKYDIAAAGADKVNGRATRKIDLTPKRPGSAPFTRATVWIDDADGMIRQFEVTESNGVVRRILLTKLEVNPAVSAADFTFIVPKGLRVVAR